MESRDWWGWTDQGRQYATERRPRWFNNFRTTMDKKRGPAFADPPGVISSTDYGQSGLMPLRGLITSVGGGILWPSSSHDHKLPALTTQKSVWLGGGFPLQLML